MAKYPKFLECINPNGDIDDIYILHTQAPRFIAAVLITNDEAEMLQFENQFKACGRTTYKNDTASIGVIEFWDNPWKEGLTPQEQADSIAKLMRRCADWYYPVLKELIDNEQDEY
jgi:hypothetical protein